MLPYHSPLPKLHCCQRAADERKAAIGIASQFGRVPLSAASLCNATSYSSYQRCCVYYFLLTSSQRERSRSPRRRSRSPRRARRSFSPRSRSRSREDYRRTERRSRSPMSGVAGAPGYSGSAYGGRGGPPSGRGFEDRAVAKEQMMQSVRDSSQQDRRVYVGNLAYDVKWHHLKDFMRQGELGHCYGRTRSRWDARRVVL